VQSLLTLAAIVQEHAKQRASTPALIFEGADRYADEVRTYADLWRNGQEIAHGLLDLGVAIGDRFAILMANHPEFIECMIAASIVGAVFVPIDPRVQGERLTHLLDSVGCSGIIAGDYALANLEAVRDSLKQVRWIYALETNEAQLPLRSFAGVKPLQTLRKPGRKELAIAAQADSAMQLIFTSGTTGEAKAVVVTHSRYCASADAALQCLGYRADDRPYTGLSLTHGNAQIITVGAALKGGLRAVLSRRFTRSRLWDIVRKYDCTTFTLLGGMTTAVYAAPPKADDADNPVRYVISAGMPAGIWRDFERRFGLQVLEVYGAIEGGLVFNPIGAGPVGSIGKPPPGLAYRIVDEAGNDVEQGMVGELWMRPINGQPFKVEYYGNAQASAEKCRDGWLHTGDCVHEDAGGWLYFDHRIGHAIRRNGEFVNPASIEKVIAESGLVEDVYVYGVQAASGAPGEKDVVAAVVLRRRPPVDPQALFEACRARLEANLVPSYIQVVAAIPKTASEKPQERFLFDAFAAHPGEVHSERRAKRATEQRKVVT
jgi:carnitine-CoA ligase